MKIDPSALRYVALSPDAKAMAENMYRALWSFASPWLWCLWSVCLARPRPVEELDGLVYGATKLPAEEPVPFYKNEWFWSALVIVDFWPSTSFSGKETHYAFFATFQSGSSSEFCSPSTAADFWLWACMRRSAATTHQGCS